MVKISKRTTKDYSCEICHYPYRTRREAERCENQKPLKVELEGEYQKTSNWVIGDFIISHHHDDRQEWRLGRIIKEEIDEHRIYPVFQFIEKPEEERYNTFDHEDVVLLNEKMKKHIQEWANTIITTDRVS